MRIMRWSALATVVATLSGVAAAAGRAAWRGFCDLSSPAAPAGDLAAGCLPLALLGIAAVCTWLGVAVVASAVQLLRCAGSAPAPSSWAPPRSVSPWLVRRLVAAVLGIATFAAVTPAYADTTPSTTSTTSATSGVDRPAPAPTESASLIDRPVAGWSAPSPQRPQSTQAARATELVTGRPRGTLRVVEDVTVRRGDSLWSIAARHLASTGRPHGVADVAREWPRWWAANAHTIGTDPDSLLPGQRLVPPAPH